MIDETLTLWENGAVTLPKEWRERYDTRHFLAKENEQGYLVIKPILDVEYYERKDGSFGLRFPSGIEMKEFVRIMDEMEERIYPKKKTRAAKAKIRKPIAKKRARSHS